MPRGDGQPTSRREPFGLDYPSSGDDTSEAGWMKRVKLKRLAVIFVALVTAAGAFLGFRAYKLHRVEKEAERFLTWAMRDVIAANPVRLKNAWSYGPNWPGSNMVNLLLESPTGSEFTINAIIHSSLTDTRITEIYVYYAGAVKTRDMSAAELTENFLRPKGIKANIDVGFIGDKRYIDLENVLPFAFDDSTL
jgi:hypothetical protein